MRLIVLWMCVLLMLAGCANSESILIRNETQETIHDVNVTWDSATGRKTHTIPTMRPGKIELFNIPTDPPEFMKDRGTKVDLNYVWLGDKYEYDGIFHYPCDENSVRNILINPGDNSARLIEIQGKTITAFRRWAKSYERTPKTGTVQ